MKVAITATGNSLDAKLDSRFGRCSYFAIYDTEKKAVENFVLNPKTAIGSTNEEQWLLWVSGFLRILECKPGCCFPHWKHGGWIDTRPSTLMKSGR